MRLPTPALAAARVGHPRTPREGLGGQDVADRARFSGPAGPAEQLLGTEEGAVEHDLGHRPPAVGAQVVGGDGEVGGRVVHQDTGRAQGALERVERRGDVVGAADVGPGVRGPAPHGLDGGRAGPAMTLVARQDPHRRPEAGELDGDGLAQAGPPPVTITVVPSKVPRREHRRAPPAGGSGSGTPAYLPSKTMGCFLALAAYPAGMSSETNSIDELMAPNRMASVKPR